MKLVVSNDNGPAGAPPAPSPAAPAPCLRQYAYGLAAVPNLGIAARRVLITEAKMKATGVWFMIAMEDLP